MSQCVKIVFLQHFGFIKNEVFEKKIAFLFFLFDVGEIETEKGKKEMEKAKKPYKNRFFKVVIQNGEKSKENGFLAYIA